MSAVSDKRDRSPKGNPVERISEIVAAVGLIESLSTEELDDLLSTLRPSTQFKMKAMLK